MLCSHAQQRPLNALLCLVAGRLCIRYSKFFGLDENSEEQAAQQASANKRTSRSAASQRTGLTQKDNLMWAAVRGITYVVITFSDTSDPRDSNAVVKFGRVLETVAGALALSLSRIAPSLSRVCVCVCVCVCAPLSCQGGSLLFGLRQTRR